MKKFFIPALFFTAVFMIAQEPLVIDYYAYLRPGIWVSNQVYNLTETRVLNEVLEELYDKTGIRIKTHFPKGHPPNQIENFEGILTNNKNPVELIAYSPVKYLREFEHNGYFLEVDELIREYAPAIFSSFPKHFWEYREQTGDVYRIPVKQYAHFDRYGFWVIKNQFLNDLGIPPEKIEENLLAITSACNPSSAPSYLNALDSKAENVFITSIDGPWFPEELITRFVEYEGYSLVDHNEFYLEDVTFQLHPISGDKWIINNLVKLEEKTSTAWNYPGRFLNILSTVDWVCAYIPLGCKYTGVSTWDLKNLGKWFSSDDYTIVSDFDLIDPVVLDDYEYLLIPANSQEAVRTIQALDLLFRDRYWYDLLTFGTGKDFAGLPGSVYSLPTGPYFYNDHNFRTPLSLLVNNRYKRIPYFLPEKVKEDYRTYLKAEEVIQNNHPLYGFDVKAAADNILFNSEFSFPKTDYLQSEHMDHAGIERLLKTLNGTAPPMDEVKQWGSWTKIFYDKSDLEVFRVKLQNRIDRYIGLRE